MGKVVRLPTVQRARAKAGKPEPASRQWTCKRCENDIKVASSTIMTLTIAPVVKGIKVIGGTKVKVCAYCWMRGIRTEVF